MNHNDQLFLREKFKEYYGSLGNTSLNITSVNQREWGFLFFDNNNFSRHIGFRNNLEVLDFCSRMGPSDSYHSAAYYESPVASNMNKKGWLGCDLIFDVDADHLETNCKKEHDLWFCKNCNKEGKGDPPEKCPSCNGLTFSKINWICDNCLKTAKKEIMKVSNEFLTRDFGLDISDIQYIFSGHRGYHIHVEVDVVKKLDSSARREIIDYIEGNGILPEYFGVNEIPGRIVIGPKRSDLGWRGRITRFVINFLKEANDDILKDLKFDKNKRNFITENVQEIINNLSLDDSNIPGIQGISWDFSKIKLKDWQKIIMYVIKNYAGKIDEPVTADTHRLIRLPNSLNGKTGFRVQILSHEKIEDFDPFTDPLVFNGTIKIKVNRAPRTVINNNSYGPYMNETVEVPTNVGIFLICKNVAELIKK